MKKKVTKYGYYPIEDSDSFSKCLTECLTYDGVDVLSPVEDHYHHRYFKAYLYDEQSPELKVKTVIVENEYTSMSYLGDFKNHYANCYKLYPKTC